MYRVWTGTTWLNVDAPKVWTGTGWQRYTPSFWDGASWQPTTVLAGNLTTSLTLAWNVANPTPTTQTYKTTKSFSATWGGTYRSSGVLRSDTSDLYQGYYSSTNGNQRSLCGFSITGIPGNATIVSASLRLYASHWYANSGGVAVIGTHNYSSLPGSYSSGGVSEDRLRYTWDTKTGSRTIDLGTSIGQQVLDGQVKGFSFGPGPTTSTTYYGSFSGTGSYRPVLTVTYTYVA